MKIQPIQRITDSCYGERYHDPSKLIHIIDEMIVSFPDIPNSYRFMTSTGLVQKQKCHKILGLLKDKFDDRSIRIKNLVERVLSFLER